MTLCFDNWPPLAIGDQVLIRDRDTAYETVVIVRRLLGPLEGEGPGFVDETGSTYRHHHHSARPVNPSDPHEQQTIDERFAELTQPPYFRITP